MMEIAREEAFKIICSKEKVCLEKSKDTSNYFRLSFVSEAPYSSICDINISEFYKLLGKLNSDIIKDVKCRNISDSEYEVILYFQQFGKDLGMAPKTMTLILNDLSNENKIHYTGKSDISKNEVSCNNSTLQISKSYTGYTSLQYNFHLDFREELPIYMDNIAGLLMKKIFLRLKQYLETSIHNVG